MKELKQHKLTIIPKYGNYYYPTSKVFEDDKGDIIMVKQMSFHNIL
jgi:hypothetical protein